MKKLLIVVLALMLCFTAHADIMQGSTGEEVAKVQEKLIELGYLDGIADGVFGKHTAEAIIQYQTDNDLAVSGVVNEATYNALFDIEEKKTEPDNILNTNTKKFHKPTCSSVAQMKDKNKLGFYGTREEAIAQGYEPCGSCKP